MTDLVVARDVSRHFGTGETITPVLHGVDLTVRAGELVLLMGPSGSGKTTLLSILAGLMRPSSGKVWLCGTEVTALTDSAVRRVRRDSLGFVFQTSNLFPALTAEENVAEVLRMKGSSRRDAHARARLALDRVGLGARLHHRPAELSGGQKQRVAIARALAPDPRVVMGDEVTSALDSTTGLAVMELLRAVISPERAVLIVTHDHRLERFADRVLEIEDGRITADRAPNPLLHGAPA